ncbi:hypothetical protein MGYG_08854 [Nannizzia gypsea CBS 118893]|uniref:Uncharacterized protein n=1 Tax=Arthroderma gypseum (strain ATCC MYA-4604 / CBS 118893) TaxID=535722 RepID=E4V763_ARTGP|nr:hypothetical protein MGYG_08854 [Nannizzia gypsea CBS 118893]EFQ96929.1 hypothetical protein MGYG_08854 [Nannizzia gypsea CBS 118893]
MDRLPWGPGRGEAIDHIHRRLLDQTSLTFLPRRQVSFLEDYAHLPGAEELPVRERIKMISDDYRRKFLRRIETVVQHSQQADIDQVSEFNWEADAWRDIFGRIRDDERLHMDKREYNFKVTVLDPSNTKDGRDSYMGKRIPDISFSLSSYSLSDPDDEGVDESERRVRRPLQRSRLAETIWTPNPRHSLVPDPKWGKLTLLFPFAVYEAKKHERSDTEVTMQLKLAFNTYLRMLDGVVRQPGIQDNNQSPRSAGFQIFGFTSNGSIWRMYVGYLPSRVTEDPYATEDPLCDSDSHMKLIWWGSTLNRQHAGELLDMVDQVHEYAVTTHRPFIASHLESWERSIEVNQWLSREANTDPDLAALTNTTEEALLDWFSIKSNGADVKKLLRDRRGKDILLTDDDVKCARLKAKLKQFEKNRQRPDEKSVPERERLTNL